MAYTNVYITSVLKKLRDMRTKETACTKQAMKLHYDTSLERAARIDRLRYSY
jgi:hypothetical protein